MTILLRGSIWHIHIEIDGRVVRQSLRTPDKKEATLRAKALERELLHNSYTKPKEEVGRTLGQSFTALWHSHYKQLKDSSGVNARYKTLIQYIPEKTLLKQIDRAMIDKLKVDMSTGGYYKSPKCINLIPYSPATINRVLALLSYILNQAEEAGYIDKTPKMPKSKEQKRTRVLSELEELGMWEALETSDNPNHQECLLLFKFLLDTGCRLGEAQSLTWAGVDFNRGVMTLFDTKSGEAVTKPLTVLTTEILAGLKERGLPDPFGHIGATMHRNAWDYAKKVIGLQDDPTLVRHSLRHTTASRLVQKGIDSQLVKSYLGHKSIQTTQRYIHLDVSALQAVVDSINNTPTTQ